MATLIPDPLPAGCTAGEKELAKLLRRLPEDWTVYHEPSVQGLRPDFVILAPDRGVLVLEAKDWKLGTVQSLDHQWVERQASKDTVARREKNPLRQVDGYWRAIKDECQGCLFGRELVQKDGEWRGNLCFPVGAVVVFRGISRADVERSPHRAAWESIFTAQNTLLSGAWKSWEDLDKAGLVAALAPFFLPFKMRERFTAHQIDILRWVLFPESRMDVILGRGRANAEQVLSVLDARQEQHARSLGSGHRILFGVAGSGKTVLLLARARWLAREQPEQRTLLLCYNKVLAAWLQARMTDCITVTVRHFDGWAKDLGVSRRFNEDGATFGTRLHGELMKRGDALRSWDALLIDEAQDFEPVWFQCALAAMKDPENGDLVIVADGSQQLYKPGRLSWKSLGIRAAGRTISARYDLDKNYRNTPRIAALAHGYSDDNCEEDGMNGTRVGPNTCRRANVSLPVFIQTGSHTDQVDSAVEIAARWLRGQRNGQQSTPLKPEEIGIFYPRLVNNRPLLDRMVAELSRLAPTRWLSRPQDEAAHRGVNEPAIKVQTIHSAKGLQYKAVIILWTDLLPAAKEAKDEERRLLYVAITRAENDLVLLGSGGRGFAGELESACAVRSWPFSTRPEPAVHGLRFMV